MKRPNATHASPIRARRAVNVPVMPPKNTTEANPNVNVTYEPDAVGAARICRLAQLRSQADEERKESSFNMAAG